MTNVVLEYEVPKEQRLGYCITPSHGRLMSLESIGGQLTALSKMLKSLMRDTDPTQKWDVLVLNITTHESGAVEFNVAICARTDKSVKDARLTQGDLGLPITKQDQ